MFFVSFSIILFLGFLLHYPSIFMRHKCNLLLRSITHSYATKHGNNTLISLFLYCISCSQSALIPAHTRVLCALCLLSFSFSFFPLNNRILSLKLNSNQKNVKSGVTALSSTSSSFGTAAASTKFDNPTNGSIDEGLKAQALAEEEAAMNQYKVATFGLF